MATDDIAVKIPPVRAFAHVEADKAHALKPLEEAAEVLSAWKACMSFCGGGLISSDALACASCIDGYPAFDAYGSGYCHEHDDLVDECCDVIQATCNLLYALGVTDLTDAMAACERRNRERGRITDGR